MAFMQQPIMVFLRKHRLDGEYMWSPSMRVAFEGSKESSYDVAVKPILEAHRELFMQLGAVATLA